MSAVIDIVKDICRAECNEINGSLLEPACTFMTWLF